MLTRGLARNVIPEGEVRLIVKVFQAERMLDVMLAVDLSASMSFGEKPWVLAYAATMIALLTAKLEDKLTLVTLGDKS